MTISNAPASLLDSVVVAQATRQEIGVAVLKKAQEGMKLQGDAVVQMLEQAGAPALDSSPPLLDVYA